MPRLQLTHEMELMGKLRAGHARPLLFVQRKTFRNPAVLYWPQRKGENAMLPILIVDDEPHIARLIEMTLEPLGQPLVLDVMLPGVDGFALMDYIAPTGTPVIFLTAKNAVADRVRGLKLGAYDYIVKPFAPAELLARVEGLLRHTGRRAATLRVFDAEVDPDNRTVTQNGRAVELTPREFTLLLVLVRARGQALYRDILYERVWGPDAEPNPRALDLHIHRLRKKLDWADKIVTVPKVGYKLLAER